MCLASTGLIGMLLAFVSFLATLFYPSPRGQSAVIVTYDTALVDGYSLTALGSKTAYRYNGLRSMRQGTASASGNRDSEGSGDSGGLRLVHVNGLFRHGSRGPDIKFSEEMANIKKRLQEV